ncbi:DUF943 family protein [Serratia plymuthica]|uniref:DUF943 family protein n=1 Tax=Serratia plymuthica TaxID=82996 RepID=UPI0018D7A2DF|nr:DUF943 family protein [Serratia plymuthica]QPS54823.1 DUF943 family protein [Serratia plymuthica]CAI2013308.1 Enterobacterial putative membrane protein (DUF943) [Serratia plymuthica]
MKVKIFTLLLIVCTLLSYSLWLSLRPVEIVAVHKEGEFSSVLVKNFPFTDKGKINWWLNNKEILKEKYKTPEPAPDGFFAITFWDFGEGYKEEGKYDRRCFDDMKTKLNCIDKNRVFSVKNNRSNDLLFTVHDGIYRMGKNGNIIKIYHK